MMRALVVLGYRADDGGAMIQEWLRTEHPAIYWTMAVGVPLVALAGVTICVYLCLGRGKRGTR
jgi:hypothetical protein